MELGQRPRPPDNGTARRILDHARRAFNQRGVAAVGIRDLARELDLSPGNLSYHFPTKEALVVALIEEAHATNNAAVATPAGPLDFEKMNSMIRGIMGRDLENQWLMRDAVSLLFAIPALRSRERRMQRAREERVDAIAARLIEAGLLERKRTEKALPRLRVQLVTQIFFWLPAAILAAPDRDPAHRLGAHASAALALFLPCCTPAGRRELEAVLDRPTGEGRPPRTPPRRR